METITSTQIIWMDALKILLSATASATCAYHGGSEMFEGRSTMKHIVKLFLEYHKDDFEIFKKEFVCVPNFKIEKFLRNN